MRARIDPGFTLNLSLTGHGTGPCLATDGMNLSSLAGSLAFSL